MHDIKKIVANPLAFNEAMKARGKEEIADKLIALDKSYRETLTSLQDMQTKRNELSKSISVVKKSGGDADAIIKEVGEIKANMPKMEEKSAEIKKELDDILASLPNAPHADVPFGVDEEANIEISKWGTPKEFDFEPKQHFELGEDLDGLDFETAAKMSGARFVVIKNKIARLSRALTQLMIDTHIDEDGYEEINAPLLVKPDCLFGTGQLPKFEDDQFKTTTGHYLIPTNEVSMTNMSMGDIIDEDTLPIRRTGVAYCFRSEAGSAGRDTRGMIRQHQFEKVEMVSITTPEKSEEELERMTSCAEKILQKLELPYRKMLLCSQDMGFCAEKCCDLEVWLPGQNQYREIASCSNCTDFQARRMNARYKKKGEKGTNFVHTLNGSGLAVGRTLVAVLENYQQADGSIIVPTVLRGYMNGLEVIK